MGFSSGGLSKADIDRAVQPIQDLLEAVQKALRPLENTYLEIERISAMVRTLPAPRLAPVYRLQSSQSDHSQCHAEMAKLRRRIRELESQLRGHWLQGSQEYDWGDDSLPWSTEEG